MKSTYLLSCLMSLVLLACSNSESKNKVAINTELANLELLRGDLVLCGGQEFGEVNFAASCKYSVRDSFNIAVALLHSFEYDEAEKVFAGVIAADPQCAMAYWGVAMSIYHSLWAPPGPPQLEKGARVLETAAKLPKTEREKDYLDAIGLYYQDYQNQSHKERALKMTKKMEYIYHKYPEDAEAAIFYALTLNSVADPTDKTYAYQRKAGKILEAIFPKYPNHPGIAHYLIHNYDNPVLAPKALATARRYALIAPASSHAQHMPSHIFTRLGLWDEAIRSNLHAQESALCYAEKTGIEGHWDEELHALDYLVYAYLQLGDNRAAEAIQDYVSKMQKIEPLNFKVAYALAAIPCRIALENRDWARAAKVAFPPFKMDWQAFPWQKAIVYFTRALGAAHLKRTDQAKTNLDSLQQIQQILLAKGLAYEANQVDIQIKTAQAWYYLALGKQEQALDLMTAAAEEEDHTAKHPVTPCEVLPARELLGDLLIELKKPDEAVSAYKKDLEDHPNRFNGMYVLANTLEQLRSGPEALLFFEKLTKMLATATPNRPEAMEIKSILNAKQSNLGQ